MPPSGLHPARFADRHRPWHGSVSYTHLINSGSRPVNVTHASRERPQKHGTQHDSDFVYFEEMFFVIHQMRIIQKHGSAMGLSLIHI